jgi:hypothetical protein
MTSEAPDREVVSFPWLVFTLVVWWLSVWKHDLGGHLAGKLFAWAKEPGKLTAEGGLTGMKQLEFYMALVFGGVALLVVVSLALRLRTFPSKRLKREITPWLVWILLLFLVWKCFIVYSTELVHFGQYALIGALMAATIGRGRYPVVAFLVTAGLGVVDEIYQHYYLANLCQPLYVTMDHWFDWSDIVLDSLGATGGILPFLTWQRLTNAEGSLPDTRRALTVALLLFGLVCLPMLFLDAQVVSEYLGHYRTFPYWGEYTNDKPTHWPGPHEGVPLVLVCTLILGTILEPKRRVICQGTLACILFVAILAVQPPSRKASQPPHERVPHATATHTEGETITLDGKLNEPAWQRAMRVGPFVRSYDGGRARWTTYARVLWDEQAIYFAFEVEDPDVWARPAKRDDRQIPGDEVVEVFLDDGGDEITYYEFELNPHNTLYDLFCFVPGAPVDYNPDSPFIGIPNWDAKGVQSAIHVDGTLDLVDKGWTVARWDPSAKIDQDKGWVAELRIPWADLKDVSGNMHAHRSVPPKPGDRWRMNLYRTERPRDLAQRDGPPFTREEARKRLGWDEAFMTRHMRPENPFLPPPKDAKGTVIPGQEDKIGRAKIFGLEEHLAWSPVWQASFHRPRHFGVLEFLPKATPKK